MSLQRFFIDSVEVTIYVVLLVGAFNYKSFSREVRIIFYFVLLGGATELFSDFYKAYIETRTGPIGHFYITTSILLICLFYRKVLFGYINNLIISSLIIAFIGFSIINLIFIQSLYDFPNFIGSSGALMVIVFSILLFSKIMMEAKIKNLWKEPVVLINIAILFYYAGNFFYFILFNLNVEYSNEFASQVSRYYCVLNDIFYIILGVVFFTFKKRKSKMYLTE